MNWFYKDAGVHEVEITGVGYVGDRRAWHSLYVRVARDCKEDDDQIIEYGKASIREWFAAERGRYVISCGDL